MDPLTIGLGAAALYALTRKGKDTGDHAPTPPVTGTHQDSGSGRPPLDGIDSSDVGCNGANWADFIAKGGAFCIHRCSDGYYKDGSGSQTNPRDWHTNGYRKAYERKPVNLPWGGYHFWRLNLDQKRQVDTIRAVVGPNYSVGHFPISIDVEGGSFNRGPTDPQARFNALNDFAHMVEAEFGSFQLYTSARVLKTYFPGIRWPQYFTRRFLWLTPYWNPPPPVPGDWVDGKNWLIHQFRGTHRYGIPQLHSGGTPPAVPVTEPTVEAVKSFPGTDLNTWHYLKDGDSSELVKMFQRHLDIDTSGIYDESMANAIGDYQSSHMLEPTGQVDPATYCLLAWEPY